MSSLGIEVVAITRLQQKVLDYGLVTRIQRAVRSLTALTVGGGAEK